MSRIIEYQNKKGNNLAKSFLDNFIVGGGIWILMSKLETQGGLETPRGANHLSYKALGIQSSQILSNGKRKRNKENIHSDDIRTWNNQQQWFSQWKFITLHWNCKDVLQTWNRPQASVLIRSTQTLENLSPTELNAWTTYQKKIEETS